MKVIGIDPAPVKGLNLFDGSDHYAPLHLARSVLNSYAVDDVLVCWDAPLTGPPEVVVNGSEASGSAFSQRPVESFFSRSYTGFKTPQGISVRGYSGCPHWAVSRSLVGLPRVGPFDAEESNLPFGLVTTNAPPARGRHIVEVHPAVAIWLWCRQQRESTASWEYKKSNAVRLELWSILCSIECVAHAFSTFTLDNPTTDDTLDARIAYVLGYLWLNGSDEVMLLGDADSGAMLLPGVDGLESAFNTSLKRAD